MTRQVNVTIPGRTSSYPIVIGEALLQSDQLMEHLLALKVSHYAIITDKVVEQHHAKNLQQYLLRHQLKTALISFPSGEEYKSRSTKEFCEDKLLNLGLGRDTCIIGMGGGIVTDLAGFVASTYCRGVPSIMIPTSLLAMVDASIGGKTGVNVPQGKNLIGTITQPTAVFIDTATLKTLPQAEIKNGMAEVIKHGLIADKAYYEFLKANADKLLQLDAKLMEEAIHGSVKIKGQIVQEDESEKGKRRLLNLGHTVAHAIEVASKHEIPHGRAVAIGIIAESYLSMKMGYLQSSEFKAICDIIHLYRIELTWKGVIKASDLLDLMKLDKKSLKQKPRFVILKEIGMPLEFDGQYCTEADEKVLDETIEWMCTNVMRSH